MRHLDFWEPKIHDPPSSKPGHIPELVLDESYWQLPETDYWTEWFPRTRRRRNVTGMPEIGYISGTPLVFQPIMTDDLQGAVLRNPAVSNHHNIRWSENS